jgi:hypothetical protein
MPPSELTTPQRRFAHARLPGPHLPPQGAVPTSLTTTVFSQRSMWWFEASPRRAAPKGLPSSPTQHRFQELSLHQGSSLRSWRNNAGQLWHALSGTGRTAGVWIDLGRRRGRRCRRRLADVRRCELRAEVGTAALFMVGGDRSTSPARRRGRRRPGDLAVATAVQSRGDANGGRSARGRRRAWPRPSRSSAVARLVPRPTGAQRQPGVIGHSKRLY